MRDNDIRPVFADIELADNQFVCIVVKEVLDARNAEKPQSADQLTAER